MKNEIMVTKRDGSKELYDVSKIKKSIHMAAEGQDVNPLELESKFDQFLKPGIKTRDIQLNVIQHAIQLATPTSPDWVNVAGRAFAMDEWANFSLRGKSFKEVVHFNVEKNTYTDELLKFYSDTDLEDLGKAIKMNRDLDHSYASLITAKKKYLGKFELNQHMHMVNAMRFGQLEPSEFRLKFVKEVYNALSQRKISLATPFLSNLRKGGNIASCFILSIDDSIDSIFDNAKIAAQISKNGGGLGLYLGKLRAKGSPVNGQPNASGSITQWIKIYNDIAVAVNQQGKRQGAFTVALPIWHNDVFDFLDIQSEHGDPRGKSYDIFPQLCIPDIFMERDKAQLPWITFCPYEVKSVLGIDIEGKYGNEFNTLYLQIEDAFYAGKLKVSRKIDNARQLTKIFMKTQIETGLPYLAFVDEINKHNPNKQDGYIPSVNLCVESYSNVKSDELGHVCNLASIVLGNIRDFKELASISSLACIILEHGITLTNAPSVITQKHNNRYRTLGIGMMGLHDYLVRENLNFRDLDVIADIAECVQYNAVKQSIELSKRFGSFEAYDVSEWKNGKIIDNYISLSNGKYNWKLLQENIDKFGIRNSQLTAIPPTTSTSIYMDSSSSILPIYNSFYTDDNINGSLVISAKFLNKNPFGYMKNMARHTASEIINVTAEFQKFIDTGISMELLFDWRDNVNTAKTLYDAIHFAFDKHLKTIYYIRSIKQTADTINENACDACAG